MNSLRGLSESRGDDYLSSFSLSFSLSLSLPFSFGAAASEVSAGFAFSFLGFSPPEGADLLAFSPACPGQAFRFGAHCYGLQFHPEVDRATVERYA